MRFLRLTISFISLLRLVNWRYLWFAVTLEMAALARKVMGNAKPRWALFKTYAKAELAPPLSPGELLGVTKAAGHLGTSIVKGIIVALAVLLVEQPFLWLCISFLWFCSPWYSLVLFFGSVLLPSSLFPFLSPVLFFHFLLFSFVSFRFVYSLNLTLVPIDCPPLPLFASLCPSSRTISAQHHELSRYERPDRRRDCYVVLRGWNHREKISDWIQRLNQSWRGEVPFRCWICANKTLLYAWDVFDCDRY